MRAVCFLLFCLFVFSCKKDKTDPVNNSKELILQPLIVSYDTVILKWSELKNADFKSYSIKKIINENESVMIASFDDKKFTIFYDFSDNYSPRVGYQIVATLKNGEIVESNTAYCDLPGLNLTLNSLQPSPDSVKLSWSKIYKRPFRIYEIYRIDSLYRQEIKLASFNQFSDTSFVDRDIPYSPKLTYKIRAILSNGSHLESNLQSYSRSEIFPINTNPFDIQFDKETKLLYFIDRVGYISVFDVNKMELKKTINIGTGINQCDFGTYNGVKELYIAETSNKVSIYNALTLDKIDDFNTPYSTFGVVYNNGLLWVSLQDLYRKIYIFKRSDKSMISITGENTYGKLKKVIGSNTQLIEVSHHSHPKLSYFEFDVDGNLAANFSNTTVNSNLLDELIFEIFPLGNKFITSTKGAVFSKSLAFEGNLNSDNFNFSSFAFDPSRKEIYAGTDKYFIEVFSEDTYTKLRRIKTHIFPFKIFLDENRLICVGTSNTGYYGSFLPEQVFIEIIKL